MKGSFPFMALLALASCQRAEDPDKARLDNLSARVGALEQSQLQLQRLIEAKHVGSVRSPAEALTLWEFRGEASAAHKYTSKERCEAALKAFESDRAAADAANGVTVVRGTELVCNPVS